MIHRFEKNTYKFFWVFWLFLFWFCLFFFFLEGIYPTHTQVRKALCPHKKQRSDYTPGTYGRPTALTTTTPLPPLLTLTPSGCLKIHSTPRQAPLGSCGLAGLHFTCTGHLRAVCNPWGGRKVAFPRAVRKASASSSSLHSFSA